jgi:hypothetical protein
MRAAAFSMRLSLGSSGVTGCWKNRERVASTWIGGNALISSVLA